MSLSPAERKRRSRAKLGARVELPLPAGTGAALTRVCTRAGDTPVGLLSQMVHYLDTCSPERFAEITTYRSDVTNVVERHVHRIGVPVPPEEDE